MKLLLNLMLILPLAAASSSVALAQTAAPAPVVQSTTVASETVDKKTYLDKQMSRLAGWRQNISDFDERMETKTTQAGQAAKLELESAWTSVEQASVSLGATAGDDWTAAKASYERAVASLEATWAKYETKKN